MRRSVLLGCLLLGLGAALSVAGFARASHSVTPVARIDPRLILHPHTVTASGSLQDLGAAHLRLYPGIPGQQHIQLNLPSSVHAAKVVVRASMVGMTMPPVVGVLRRQGASYRGKLHLAMFGQYRLVVRLPAGGSVALRVALALPAP